MKVKVLSEKITKAYAMYEQGGTSWEFVAPGTEPVTDRNTKHYESGVNVFDATVKDGYEVCAASNPMGGVNLYEAGPAGKYITDNPLEAERMGLLKIHRKVTA